MQRLYGDSREGALLPLQQARRERADREQGDQVVALEPAPFPHHVVGQQVALWPQASLVEVPHTELRNRLRRHIEWFDDIRLADAVLSHAAYPVGTHETRQQRTPGGRRSRARQA